MQAGIALAWSAILTVLNAIYIRLKMSGRISDYYSRGNYKARINRG